jgi:hypothetical protein
LTFGLMVLVWDHWVFVFVFGENKTKPQISMSGANLWEYKINLWESLSDLHIGYLPYSTEIRTFSISDICAPHSTIPRRIEESSSKNINTNYNAVA